VALGNDSTADPAGIFCRIVAREAERQELYRDEATLACMDIHPANGGSEHILLWNSAEPSAKLAPWAGKLQNPGPTASTRS
jgi:hypothetical protein